MGKDEALKKALDDLIAEYHMETSSFAKRVDEIFEQALAAPVQEPVAWMYPDDYERMTNSETFCTVYSVEVGSATRGESTVALYTTPPAAAVQEGRDWSLLEATQESLREHMAEIKRLKEAQRTWVGLSQDELDAMFSNTIKGKKLVNWVSRAIEAKLKEKNAAAQPAVPDALTSADIQEHIEYVAGWNECRQAMLEMMK